MNENRLYDINEVCKLLETTSRTLRFYEEKGIIQSTKSDFSSRRQYTEEQVDQIRNVIVLRTLGLSVKVITELQSKGIDLKSAVLSRRAEMMAVIEEKHREIRILNEALTMLDEGRDIFEYSPTVSVDQQDPSLEEIAQRCTHDIINGESETLYKYLSPKMHEYMPLSVYHTVRTDTLAPMGAYIAFDRAEYDKKYPNVLYHYVKYEKIGLKIKYIFHNNLIQGLWMGYYHTETRK